MVHSHLITIIILGYMHSVLSEHAKTPPHNCTAQDGGFKQSNVFRHLLQDYDNLLRPNFDKDTATTVTVDLYVNNVDSISVESMDFAVNIYVRQEWQDPRLAFGKYREYSNISRLTVDSKIFAMIWVPDLFFPNEKKGDAHFITVPNRLIRIDPNGRVLYSSRYTLLLACDMYLRPYPFDRQKCGIRLESYAYTTDELQFQWREKDALQINANLQLPQFYLNTWKTGQCRHSYIIGDFTCLDIILHLERQYSYFLLQTYLPSMLTVILSWVSFWINNDAVPARISLGVMTVLTQTTQSVGVWMSLPRVSYVKAIDVWMSTGVLFVFLALLEFALVNTLSRQEIRRLSIRARNEDNDNNMDIVKRMVEHHTYGTVSRNITGGRRMLARKVDKYSRAIFPIMFLIFNTVYWSFYLINR